MGPERYGYPGDGFGDGENAPANVPSLPSDGDPFFHEPVSPTDVETPEYELRVDPGSEAPLGNCTCIICERQIIDDLEKQFEKELET